MEAIVRWGRGIRQRWTPGALLGGGLLLALCLIALLGLVLPSLLVVMISFNDGELLQFPPKGFSLRWYESLLNNWEFMRGASVSLYSSFATMLIDILLGVPAAWALVRGKFRGRELVSAFLLSPLMLPGMVVGIGILFLFSSMGLNITTWVMILSHVVVTLPFVVRVTMAQLYNLDPVLEEAAQNLGATPRQTFQYIVLPRLWSGLGAGAAFAFLTSFDNVTVSLFTASVRDRPLPLYVFYLLLYDTNPVVAAISTLEIVLALLILIVGSRLSGLSKVKSML